MALNGHSSNRVRVLTRPNGAPAMKVTSMMTYDPDKRFIARGASSPAGMFPRARADGIKNRGR